MTITSTERDQLRAEVRRILRFLRAANRLREVTTKYPLNVTLEFKPALVQPADPRQCVMASVKIVKEVDRLVIDNLATRLRPFMMPKEDCFFP